MKNNRRFRKRKPEQTRIGIGFFTIFILLVGSYVWTLDLARPHVTGDRIRLDRFVDLVQTGKIKDAHLLDVDGFVVGDYETKNGKVAPYNAPYLKNQTSLGFLTALLLENRIPTTVDQQNTKRVAALGTSLLPPLILILALIYLFLSWQRGSGLFAVRSGARKVGQEQTGVTFADVAGHEQAITELKEVVDFLKSPERFRELGARIPKGILLYGPPGCGKTLLAKALASEAGASFYSISGSDFIEIWVGVGAARVRDLFKQARENVPAIVFIDELDSVGRSRSGADTSAVGEYDQAVNQILAEMDGFTPFDGIVVVGATNRPDVLDTALLRPGRFDRTVGLERPGEQTRKAILEVHSKGKHLEPGADLGAIAEKAIGLSGADLANVMNEGALLAARAGKHEITQGDLDQALQRILEEPERQRRLSLRDRAVGHRTLAEERVTFGDVAGVDDALEELGELSEYLGSPDRYLQTGARVPTGILLVGPPGCGKTLLARAVAGEANAAFFSVAATEFVEILVGQGARRVRDLFAEARSMAPAIVFIDEIDAVGGHRAIVSLDGHRERENTLNQILVELDGFEPRSGVVVVAATNRPDMLDPALVRPGRFDRQIMIELPDRDGRRAILELHSRGKPLASGIDFDAIARLSRGFSGADLANVVNEAALLAARRRLSEITMALMEEGIDRAMLGISSRGHVMTDEERLLVAYHEAGHALVGRALPGAARPHKLSIAGRGRALGFVTRSDEHDRVVQTRSALMDELAGLLGGRVAEEIVFGDPSGGASDDLARVGDLARRMVCTLGMSEALGPLTYPDGPSSDGGPRRGYSDEIARQIDTEVRRLVDEAHELARGILTASRPALDRVAQALVESETLTAEELEKIAGPAPEPAPARVRPRSITAD